MKRRLFTFGFAAIGLALFSAAVAIAMAFALRGDVSRLDGRAREVVRVQKGLRAQIAMLKDDIAVLEAPPAAAEPPVAPVVAPPVAAPRPVIRVGRSGVSNGPRIVPASVSAPRECVFKPGDPYGLADCIRSQQANIGAQVASAR